MKTYVDVLFSGVTNEYDPESNDSEYLVTASQHHDVPGMLSFTSIEEIEECIDRLTTAKELIESNY